MIGRSLFGFYVYKNLGMIQNAEDVPSYFDQNMYQNPLYANSYATAYREGMYQLADLNGDGRIDADNDRYYAASTLPLASGGFANEIMWKGFDLNVLFTFSFGRKMINRLKKGGLVFDTQFGPVFQDYRNLTFWQNREMKRIIRGLKRLTRDILGNMMLSRIKISRRLVLFV